jgi:hypothetical protein
LGFVEGDVGDVLLRRGEVDDGFGGWVVAPSDGGVEIADQVCGEYGGEGFAVEFSGEAGGEVLEHDEADEEGVAGCPGSGLVMEEAELKREVGSLEVDRSVDAGRVSLEEMKLVRWDGRDSAVSGEAKLKGALKAVVDEQTRAENFGESASAVAAESIHLPETILRSREALGEEEVVERGGADVRDAVGVALDCNGGREAWDRDGTVELWEGVLHALAEPVVRGEGANDNDEDHEGGESDDDAPEDASAFGLQRGFFGGEGFVGDYVDVGEMG